MAVPRKRLFERIVFLIHGVVTLAAAIALALSPDVISSLVGILFSSGSFPLFPSLLASAELAVAVISFGAVRLTERTAVRLIAAAFLLMHAAAAALEIMFMVENLVIPVVVINVVVRIIAVIVFAVIWGNRRRTPTVRAENAADDQ